MCTAQYGSHSKSHARSSRVTGLSNRSLFGYPLPFELTTCMRFILPYTTPRSLTPLSDRSLCRRRTSKPHPQLLPS